MCNVSKASMQRGESLVAIYNTMNIIKHLKKNPKKLRERAQGIILLLTWLLFSWSHTKVKMPFGTCIHTYVFITASYKINNNDNIKANRALFCRYPNSGVGSGNGKMWVIASIAVIRWKSLWNSEKHQNCNDLFLGPLSAFEENLIKTLLHLFKLFCLFYRHTSTNCQIKSSLGGGGKKAKSNEATGVNVEHSISCACRHQIVGVKHPSVKEIRV